MSTLATPAPAAGTRRPRWTPQTHPPAPTLTLPERDALNRIVHPVVIPGDDPWPHRPPAHYTGRLGTLARRLVTIGGGQPCFDYTEPDLAKILARGQVFSGRCRLLLGEPHQCHANSAAFYQMFCDEFPVHIVTGYALGGGGGWYQHSWVIAKPYQRWTLIESTCRRLLYYGVILNDFEMRLFCNNNFY